MCSTSSKLIAGFFYLSAPKMTAKTAERLLNEWYKKRTEKIFRSRLNYCLGKFPDIQKPNLTIKSLKTKWGTMSKEAELVLNKDLIRAPLECIDYIIIHELCHIKYPHHGRQFWLHLEKKLPSWQKLKNRLEMKMS